MKVMNRSRGDTLTSRDCSGISTIGTRQLRRACRLFLIARDPVRYRPLMLVGFLAKLSSFGTCAVLYLIGRPPPNEVLLASLVDGVLMVLFLVAYLRMDRIPAPRTAS